MLTMKLMRVEGAKADLSEWEFGTSGELSKALTKELQDRLDVFFSENGANALLEIDLYGKTPEEFVVLCEINIEESVAYARGKTTLRELLVEPALDLEDEDREKIANALRAMANEIAPNDQHQGPRSGPAGCAS